jgi:hypothetical protein
MIRILLLDCPPGLTEKLKKQGYDVEAGTVGFATGKRRLPCQVYERDVFFYSPSTICIRAGSLVDKNQIEDASPEFDLKYLGDRIEGGATFVVFVNRLVDDLRSQNGIYSWIPFMPRIVLSKDKTVHANRFESYPDSDVRFLAPIVAPSELDLPVLQKLEVPPAQQYPRDIFPLYWNDNGDRLGVFMARGRGALIALPRFRSNESAITTFIQRVIPKMYDIKTRVGPVDRYVSSLENKAQEQVSACESELERVGAELEKKRVDLAAARLEKGNVILGDPTAKQILNYYDTALRQDDVALFYLYKAVELIENNHGGESGAIKKFGVSAEWKFLKKTANASYADIRHAPKPGDVIQQWSEEDIKACFDACEKIVLAYFGSLFP